jgi:hypothetical protein
MVPLLNAGPMAVASSAPEKRIVVTRLSAEQLVDIFSRSPNYSPTRGRHHNQRSEPRRLTSFERNTMKFDVPDPVQAEIRSLRRECLKLRIQRNEARAELAALKLEVGVEE